MNVLVTEVGLMLNHSPLSNESITPSNSDSQPDSNARRSRLVRTLKPPAQFLAFWIAITLPFIHVPLLMRGLDEPGVTLTFLFYSASTSSRSMPATGTIRSDSRGSTARVIFPFGRGPDRCTSCFSFRTRYLPSSSSVRYT
jgi:hypothetical protein